MSTTGGSSAAEAALEEAFHWCRRVGQSAAHPEALSAVLGQLRVHDGMLAFATVCSMLTCFLRDQYAQHLGPQRGGKQPWPAPGRHDAGHCARTIAAKHSVDAAGATTRRRRPDAIGCLLGCGCCDHSAPSTLV